MFGFLFEQANIVDLWGSAAAVIGEKNTARSVSKGQSIINIDYKCKYHQIYVFVYKK